MGAGVKRAGDLYAGHELPAGAVVFVPLEQAPAYDPLMRAIPLDSDGRAVTVHWVDQDVALYLSVPLGSLGPLPLIGTDIEQLKTATVDNVDVVVSNVVELALAPLIKQRAVEIVDIATRFRPGSLAYQVHYHNLLIPTPVRTLRKVTLPPGIPFK